MMFKLENCELDALGVKYNTNKSSSWVDPSKNERITKTDSLLLNYEFFLRGIKNKANLKMLELGAGPDDNIGASVRVWRDYFKKDAEIHVADIKESTKALDKEGIHTHVGDLGSQMFLNSLKINQWDFVIDDASHLWIHQIMSFRSLFPKIKKGGIFIMEDLCTSFGTLRENYSQGIDLKDPVAYFTAISRVLCGGCVENDESKEIYSLSRSDYDIIRNIRMLSWVNNSCIIIKR